MVIFKEHIIVASSRMKKKFYFLSRRDMPHFGVEVSITEPVFFKTGVTSLEVIERDLLRLWNRLSSEARESYGDMYFVKCKYKYKI